VVVVIKAECPTDWGNMILRNVSIKFKIHNGATTQKTTLLWILTSQFSYQFLYIFLYTNLYACLRSIKISQFKVLIIEIGSEVKHT
jgi:hypothetical protein